MPHSPSHPSSRWAQQQRERLREERLEAMTAAVQPIMLRAFSPAVLTALSKIEGRKLRGKSASQQDRPDSAH